MAKVETIEMNFVPICPSCKRTLDQVAQDDSGLIFTQTILACPYCHVFLGFSTSNTL